MAPADALVHLVSENVGMNFQMLTIDFKLRFDPIVHEWLHELSPSDSSMK